MSAKYFLTRLSVLYQLFHRQVIYAILYAVILFSFFLIGLPIGSFLNVLIDRLPKKESIWKGRSHCDYCKHILAWYDLIPVLSFLSLRANCRYCHKKISWQYPAVELLTAVLFTLTLTFLNRFSEAPNLSFTLVYYLTIVSGLIVIFFADWKYRIIPDQVLISLTAVTLFFLFIFTKNELINHFLAGIIIFLVFLTLVVITSGKGMGFGDVKYAFVMGFILGIPSTIISFYLSFLTGAAISLILVVRGSKTMKSTIPFGPFLVAGTLVSLFYGSILWIWFKQFTGL